MSWFLGLFYLPKVHTLLLMVTSGLGACFGRNETMVIGSACPDSFRGTRPFRIHYFRKDIIPSDNSAVTTRVMAARDLTVISMSEPD